MEGSNSGEPEVDCKRGRGGHRVRGTPRFILIPTLRAYRFGWKSWLGNAAAPPSGALITMKEWSVVAWQALHPAVRRA